MRWVAFKTLVRRERDDIARFWLVTVAPPGISTFLYFAVFGGVLGARIGPMAGVPYIEYMAPGLIALTTIPSAFMHSAAGMLGARFIGFIEELLVAPQPKWMLLAGSVAGGVMRGLFVAAISTSIAVCFSGFHRMSIVLTVAALVLAAMVSSTAGFITGLLANSFEKVSVIQGLVLVPLAFLGGVFVPISSMPEWARLFSKVNPVFHMVNAIRGALTGESEVPVGVSFAVVAAFAAVLLVVAVRLVVRRELRFQGASG